MGKTGSGRRQRKLNGLKSKYRDCWVGGERFGFSRCKAAGADETEQKHLLIIFAAATLKKNLWRTFARLRTQSRIELLHYHEASGLASVEWARAPGRANGAYTTNAVRPSGRCISSLNLKERKQSIVETKHEVIRRSSGKRRASYLFLSFLKIN